MHKPWLHEPDRKEWKSEHGFPCIIQRGIRHQALCGYVGVPPGHRWYGKDLGEIWNTCDIDVHGGVTYSRECQEPICHKPEPGEPDNLWWVGFDCLHLGDYAPGMTFVAVNEANNSYKDMDYVTAECEKLAAQAKDAMVAA